MDSFLEDQQYDPSTKLRNNACMSAEAAYGDKDERSTFTKR